MTYHAAGPLVHDFDEAELERAQVLVHGDAHATLVLRVGYLSRQAKDLLLALQCACEKRAPLSTKHSTTSLLARVYGHKAMAEALGLHAQTPLKHTYLLQFRGQPGLLIRLLLEHHA